jgi:hypothetical protein
MTAKAKKQSFRVTYDCEGITEVDIVQASSSEEAQALIEATFPAGRGWKVRKVEPVLAAVEALDDSFIFAGN